LLRKYRRSVVSINEHISIYAVIAEYFAEPDKPLADIGVIKYNYLLFHKASAVLRSRNGEKMEKEKVKEIRATKMLTKTQKLVFAAVLTSLILVMAFTPVGYLKIGVVEITFLTIPVSIGAILLGEYFGIYFGFLFGITSFVQCFGASFFGTFMSSQSLSGAFVTCVISRCLVGYITGVVFKLCSKRDKKGFASFVTSAVASSVSNTILFVGSFLLFFANKAYILGDSFASIPAIITTLVTFNSLIEIATCAIIAVLISRVAIRLIRKGTHR